MKKKLIKRNGFSLIEMLAVMFIIGIIFSIVLLAFGPTMSTMRLNAAAENLANALESAKQYAQTSGVDCYVVFPAAADDAILGDRAYKLYSWDGASASGRTIGKWEFLPKGIVIDQTCSFITSTPDPIYPDPTTPESNSSSVLMNFPEDTGGKKSIRCIKFKPNGSAALMRTIRLTSVNGQGIWDDVIFYNQPIKIKVKSSSERT